MSRLDKTIIIILLSTLSFLLPSQAAAQSYGAPAQNYSWQSTQTATNTSLNSVMQSSVAATQNSDDSEEDNKLTLLQLLASFGLVVLIILAIAAFVFYRDWRHDRAARKLATS